MLENTRTTLRRRTKVGFATAAAAALVVTGAGFSAPATAESAATAYTCTTPIGPQTFTVVNDSDAPAKLAVGQSHQIKLTSEVTIPEALSSLAYGVLEARSIDGTAVAQGVIGSTPTVSDLTVPSTPVEAAGDLVVLATGNAGTLTAPKVGNYALKGGDFAADLTFRKENGDEALAIETACTAPEGTDTTYDTVKVVKDKTKIATIKVKNKVKRHKKVKVKAKVKSVHGVTPNGKVTMIVKKGKKTIQKKNVKLNKKGLAKTKFKKLHKKGTYKVIAKYKGAKNFKGAAKKVQKFKVK